MAECSYARCVQQRRNIRRELQRWTKNMVHIVGLERIAEELMGRRKWKLYQESMSRSYLQPLNNNVKRTNSQEDEYHTHKDSIISNNKSAAALAAAHTQLDSELDKTESTEKIHRGEPPKDTTYTSPTKGDEEKDGTGGRTTDQKENSGGEKTPEVEDRLKDWKPQTKCYFCVDGKLDSEHTAHGVLSPRHSDSDTSDSHSDSEAPPSLTPSGGAGLLNNNNHHHPQQHRPGVVHHPVTPANMTTIENIATLAAVFSGANSPGTAAAHLPFYPPSVLAPHWYLNVARNFQAPPEVDKTSGEQPLDLSKGSSNSSSGGNNVEPKTNNSVNVRLPTLDTKHIFKAKPRMSAVAGRRTYTEDELQAALRDIQSGKLGTRRAAVIYGIPRSTLRNKVYKLALERERESHLNNTPLKVEEDAMDEDERELSGTEEEKAVEKVLDAPLLSMADILRFNSMEPPEALKSFLQKASQNLFANHKPADGAVLNHIIPEFVKRMISDEQLLKLHLHNNGDSEKLTRPSPSNSVITKVDKPKSESDMEAEESPSNVILKIPSYKPTSSKNGCDTFSRSSIEPGSMVSPPVTSESGSPPILPGKGGLVFKDIKDAIAQNISQKFQQNLEPRRPISLEMDFKRGDYTPPLGSGMSVIKTQPEINRPYQQPPPKPQQNQGSSSTTGGKGTRPKRGKYRNYDRDSLVEAVRAVQRGEMSVHRAGSYYGVPHSTLEYKVKERHLMRPRKRDPKPNPVDEKIASLKQNDIRNSQEKLKPVVMKPPQKFPPTSPNGMKLPIFEPGMAPLTGFSPTPFPFWPHPNFHHIPLEYGRNPTSPFPPNPSDFFASQMIQKLQEESSRLGGSAQSSTPGNTPTLAKSARQMAESLLDGTGSNGSFLDGIIRSSLESGVPSSEEKSSKEDKNVAPENMSNKALLDQLCRNSRLTPLTKPATTDPNSSGDESYRKGSSPLNFSTGANSQDENMDCSPRNDRENSDVHTIELSNDSNESTDHRKQINDDNDKPLPTPPPGRIYLKQDLAKPENLKPEMLVRYREVLPDLDRNGVNESATGSASDTDAPQD